jgi:hypothetical protein
MSRDFDSFDMFQDKERGRFGENELQSRPGSGPRVTGASDLVDVTLQLQQDRPLALMVTKPDEPGSKWISLPKSLIEYIDAGGGKVIVTLRRGLAVEKGLV